MRVTADDLYTDGMEGLRHLHQVLGRIIEVAPELKRPLREVTEPCLWGTPALTAVWWEKAGEILQRETVGHPRRDELIRIFGGGT